MTLTVAALDGILTTQDRGRIGMARYGVGTSGAADRTSAKQANTLVGNDCDAALLELAGTVVALRAMTEVLVAVTGATRPVEVETARPSPHPPGGFAMPVLLSPDDLLWIGPAARGVFSYLAVRGGFQIAPVLGSCSFDVLAGIGPPPLRIGDVLEVGTMVASATVVGPPVVLPSDECLLRVVEGPRDGYIIDSDALYCNVFHVGGQFSRTALRLMTPNPLVRCGTELPSEGLLPGAIQVPGDGQPIVFLADHPVTGGYPVVGCLLAADVDRAAQCRPGTQIRFVRARSESSV